VPPDWLLADLCVCVMLLTYALQGSGIMTNRTPQPIGEKRHTVGQSYDTASGRVFTMTTRGDVTMTTVCLKADQQARVIPVSATDDVITGGPLITINEVKTPTSPPELLPSIYDVTSMAETSRTRTLDLCGSGVSVMSSLTPLIPPKSPLDDLRPGPSWISPQMPRVVCWLAWT